MKRRSQSVNTMTNYQNHTVEQQLENTQEEVSDSVGLGKRLGSFMCGWGVLVTAGIMSLTFLLCVSFVPSTNIFPVYRDPYKDMIPLVQQGKLMVYPPLHDPNAVLWKNDTYFITVPPSDLAANTESLRKIMESYPQNEASVYRQCWLQNPTYEHPCFFDVQWLGNECTKTKDFGYREVNGTFSPCVILRFEDTGKWEPVPDARVFQKSMKTGSDPGFLRMNCYLKFPSDSRKFKSIHVYPQKGFSRMYFPMANFDPKLYLHPLVTVQVVELTKGENVTILCQIGAENALYLKNDGSVTISFGA